MNRAHQADDSRSNAPGVGAVAQSRVAANGPRWADERPRQFGFQIRLATDSLEYERFREVILRSRRPRAK